MKALNRNARIGISGDFIELSNGVVHYKINGPENGDRVVLIHGLSTPMFAWDHNYEALTEKGFRVLRYDLYGRGYSDRPKTDYSIDLFVRQLEELLSSLGIKEKVNLIGWSMGAAVSAAYTDRYPDRVDKITFIAPAGFPVNLPATAKLLSIPVFGGILMAFAGEKALLKSLEGLFYDAGMLPDYTEKFKEQMQYGGFLRAIHSTICHFPFDMSDTFRRIGEENRSALLIWGEQDDVTPFSNSEKVKELILNIDFLSVGEAKHAVHYEKPDIVNSKIISFLSA